MNPPRRSILPILMVLAFAGSTVTCAAQFPPPPVPPDDDVLYGDLLKDPYAARFLAVQLNASDCGTILRPTDEELAEIYWAQDQESKVYPLLLEILRREEDLADGLSRKGQAIAYVLGSDRGGDKTIILEEMRKQLPQWKERYQGASHDAFVYQALRLFGRFGEAADAEILRAYLDPKYKMMSSVAMKELARLENRLAAKAGKTGDPGESPSMDPAGSAGPGHTPSASRGRGIPKFLWVFAILAVGLALRGFAARTLA